MMYYETKAVAQGLRLVESYFFLDLGKLQRFRGRGRATQVTLVVVPVAVFLRGVFARHQILFRHKDDPTDRYTVYLLLFGNLHDEAATGSMGTCRVSSHTALVTLRYIRVVPFDPQKKGHLHTYVLEKLHSKLLPIQGH